jgi:hypothetical protein
MVPSLAVSGSYIVAGTVGSGPFRSRDNGEQWTPISDGLTDADYPTLFADVDGLFIGTHLNGIFRSTDNGTSWTHMDSGLAPTAICAFARSGWNLFAATNGNGIFRSTDNGTTWSSVDSALATLRVGTLLVDGRYIFAGTIDGWVYRSSDNGETWMLAARATWYPGITCMVKAGPYLYVGSGAGGVYRSSDNGDTWTRCNTRAFFSSVTSFVALDSILITGTRMGMYRSNIYNDQWDDYSWSSLNIYSLALFDSVLFAGTDGGVWRTPVSWLQPRTPSPPTHLHGDARDGRIELWWDFDWTRYRVYRSLTSSTGYVRVMDTLLTYTTVDSGLVNGTTYYYVVRAVDPVTGWESGNSNEFSATPHSDAVAPQSPTDLGVSVRDRSLLLSWSPSTTPGVAYRVLRSLTGGTGFQTIIDSMSIVSVIDTGLVNGRTYYYVVRAFDPGSRLESPNSNEASGTPRRLAGGVENHLVDKLLPTLTPVPNPISATVALQYVLDYRTSVTLTITDALGRIISSPLVDEMQESGKHEVLVAAGELAPGSYICHLRAADFEASTKIVVVR